MAPLALAAFEWPLQFCAFTTLATYIATLITGNVSQIDRLWTFLPTIYAAYFALLPLFPVSVQPFPLCPYVPEELRFAAQNYSPRAVLMLCLIVTWMFRLSYNTYRRGLFSMSEEDYRWAVLRLKIPPWLFQFFNLTFIAIIQNVLLLSLAYPVFVAVTEQPHNSLALSDVCLALLGLIVLALEFTSDNQQFAYQTFKYSFLGKGETYDAKKQWPGSRLNWTAEDANRGFVTRGLWSYSRHPNCTCEQTFWWVIAFIPLVAPYPPSLPHYDTPAVVEFLNTTFAALQTSPKETLSSLLHETPSFMAQFCYIAPPIALTALFLASTKFTEEISSSKYPTAYAAYKRRVAMFSPSLTIIKRFWLAITGDTETEPLIWGSNKGKEKET